MSRDAPPPSPRPAAVRALSAEWCRSRADPLPWGLLPILLLLVGAAMAPLANGELRGAPATIVDAAGAGLRASLTASVLLLIALMAALRIAIPIRAGAIARESLLLAPGAVLAVRALSTAIAAMVLGILGAAGLQAGFLIATGRALLTLGSVAQLTGASAMAGLWGFCVGAIVRSPLVVLFVVPATLSPALLLASVVRPVADVLPLAAFVDVSGAGHARDPAAPALIAVAWLLLAGAAVALSVRRRDQL